MLDVSAERRFGPFQVGEYREFQGRRLKIIGRTREALSFTTSPIAFLDYRLAQSLSPADLSGRTTFTVVRLEPGADAAAVRREICRRLLITMSTRGTNGPAGRAVTGSKTPGSG